jgi:hypothetical protein
VGLTGKKVLALRWMKKLLLGIYLYMAVFFGVCLIVWILTGEEPAALIAGISAAVGVESIAAGFIRIYETKEQYKQEKEIQNEYSEAKDDFQEAVGSYRGDRSRSVDGFRPDGE